MRPERRAISFFEYRRMLRWDAINTSDGCLRHSRRKSLRKPIFQPLSVRRSPHVVLRSCGIVDYAYPSHLPRSLSPVEQLNNVTGKRKKYELSADDLAISKCYLLYCSNCKQYKETFLLSDFSSFFENLQFRIWLNLESLILFLYYLWQICWDIISVRFGDLLIKTQVFLLGQSHRFRIRGLSKSVFKINQGRMKSGFVGCIFHRSHFVLWIDVRIRSWKICAWESLT